MTPYYIRAIRGPIILITFGVLFTLDYSGAFGFERTWPVIIIVFGLFKLLERMAGGSGYAVYQPAYPPPAGYAPAGGYTPPQPHAAPPSPPPPPAAENPAPAEPPQTSQGGSQ